jgi:hypothetical protein
MTTRERVMVAGMAGVLIWGVSSAAIGWCWERGGRGATGAPQASAPAFAESQRAILAPVRLQPQERLVLDVASAEWAPTPFIDRVSAAETIAVAVQEFFYTGFVRVGSQQFAILNGREYRVADRVEATDFRVESIQPNQVVLVSESGGRRRTVALQVSNEMRDSK